MKQIDDLVVADAMADPGSVFATPDAVVAHPQLCDSDKLEILRQWRRISELEQSEGADLLEEDANPASLSAIDDAIAALKG